MNNDRFWTFAATQWHRLYMPYVPFKTGTLANTVSISPGEINHTVPYAHYQYEGVRFRHNVQHHPMAAAHWDQAAEASQLPRLTSTLQSYINSGGISF